MDCHVDVGGEDGHQQRDQKPRRLGPQSRNAEADGARDFDESADVNQGEGIRELGRDDGYEARRAQQVEDAGAQK